MQTTNSKPALVLLHGFCEDSTLWDHIIPLLKFDGDIITPNLPGFGKTKLPFSKFSLKDVAQQIYRELSSEGIEQCICIGHSLGGYITLALKSQYPNFVKAIGLIHSTALADTPEKKYSRDKLIKFLDLHEASRFLNSFASTLFYHKNASRLQNEIEKVVGMSKGLDNNTIQQYARAMRDRIDYTNLLFNEEAPLFIAGKCDLSVPIEDSKAQINSIKNQVNCYFLSDVAHMGMYESPSVIIKAINHFTDHNRLAKR